MESFTLVGVWWLPTDIEKQFAGKLSFHPSFGGILNIVESHASLSDRTVITSTTIDFVHGYVGDGRFVILANCSWENAPSTHRGSEGRPSVTDTKLTVEYVILSNSATGTVHYESLDDITFDSMSVSYPYLAEWLTTPNLESLDRESHQYQRSEFEPEDIALEKPEVTLSVHVPARYSDSEAEITIKSETSLHLSAFVDLMNVHLADFLTFATSHTNYPVNVTGIAGQKLVRIFYRVVGYGESLEEYMTSYEMLFTYRDVKPNIKDCLNKWIAYRENLGVIYELVLKSYYGKVTEFETAFLFLAQALEVFHRKEFPSKRHSTKAEYREIRRVLSSSIPKTVGKGVGQRKVSDDHRNHLESIISVMGNSYSLKTKILDLLQECSAIGTNGQMQQIIGVIIGTDWNDFAVRIRDTRNYYTHHDKPSKKVIPPGHLEEYVRAIIMLIKMLLLIKLGFNSGQVQHAIVETSIDTALVVTLRKKRLGLLRNNP